MSNTVLASVPDAAELALLDPQRLAQMVLALAAQVDSLKGQVEWFRRQIFGQKSERYAPQGDAQQMHLGELMPIEPLAPEPRQEVPAHHRARPRSDFADDKASAPFFDESKVPVVTIEVPNPQVAGLSSEQYEVVGQKTATAWRSAPALRGAEVRAHGDQAARYADAALPGRAGGGDRGQPRRRELHRRRAGGQVRLAPAACTASTSAWTPRASSSAAPG
jgi:hypothetical protein